MEKRVAANAIPLNIASMCLDNKARYDFANMPWNKMKFIGGNIAVSTPRHKENPTINQARLAYIDASPGMNNVDHKIMWKMYDRERDYNWIYVINYTERQITAPDVTKLDQSISRDTAKITQVKFLTESTDVKRKIRLGQTVTAGANLG